MDDNVRRACVIISLEELRNSLLCDTSEVVLPSCSQQNRESGAEYIYRLLNENQKSCQEQLRLDRNMFKQLVTIMIDRNLLEDAKYIKVDEQVGICLYVLAKGASYRDVTDRFKHSLSTISKYFKKVLDALVILSHDIIRPHQDLLEVPDEVQSSTRYWPFFKNAIGAIDGTHIEAVVSDRNGVPFRSRSGNKSWNVMASCSFNRLFTFINVGWEGSAHDLTVWRDSLSQSKFCFPHPPKDKYYLVDSGYPNTLGYLSPITLKHARYHIPEYKRKPPQGMDEHFNYLHSSLRMKIEQAFGILKSRWKVLRVMPQMSQEYQMKIIVSTFTLHNFILMHTLGIPIVDHNVNVQGLVDTNMHDKNRMKAMKKVRDKISEEIWNAYLSNLYEIQESEDDNYEEDNNMDSGDMEIDE